jgi:hypothetical protein
MIFLLSSEIIISQLIILNILKFELDLRKLLDLKLLQLGLNFSDCNYAI